MLGEILVLAVIIGSFLFGRYVMPNLSPGTQNMLQNAADELMIITKYADRFVIWARDFFKDKKGSEKMDEVIKQLEEIAEKYGIKMTKEQIRAITQTAYDNMMANNTQVSAQAIAEQAIEAVKIVASTSTTPADASADQPVMVDESLKVVKE